jgi:hypothetical protein
VSKNKKRRRKPIPPAPSMLLIPREDVGAIWPLAAPFIAAAAVHGEYSDEMLWSWCVGGEAQLWLAWSDHCEAAMVTRPIGQACLIAALGGKNMDRWMHLLPELEAWAKAQGYLSIRTYARPGWARKLRDYKMSRVILDKVLT